MDIAKRLLDYGFHAPTVYFPLIVSEAMMIEPTETESKETLDAFAETLFRITEESPELLHDAPHTTAISRPDEVAAARNRCCTGRRQRRTMRGSSVSWNCTLRRSANASGEFPQRCASPLLFCAREAINRATTPHGSPRPDVASSDNSPVVIRPLPPGGFYRVFEHPSRDRVGNSRRVATQQHEYRPIAEKRNRFAQQSRQIAFEFPALPFRAVAIAGRIENHGVVAIPAGQFALDESPRIFDDPADRSVGQSRKFRVPLRPSDRASCALST